MSEETNIHGYYTVLKDIIDIWEDAKSPGANVDGDVDIAMRRFFDKYALTLVEALSGPYHCDMCGQQYREYKMCCDARRDYLSHFKQPPLDFPDDLNPAVQIPLIIKRIRAEMDLKEKGS
jgi:hypothetical protein